MKNTVIAAALALATLAPAAYAAEDDGHYYAGGSVGRTSQKLRVSGYTDTFKETGFKVLGGYQIDHTFGAELGFAGLGKTDSADGGLRVTARSRSFYAAGTATLPLGKFFLRGKLGIAKNHIEIDTYLLPVAKVDKSDVYQSIGGGFNVSQRVSIVAEYENYGTMINEMGTTVKTRILSAGVNVAF